MPNHGPLKLTYKTAHKLLGQVRGYCCELELDGCQRQAVDWALDWRVIENKNLRWDPLRPGWFSIRPFDDYIPVCRKCHRKLDRAHGMGIPTELDLAVRDNSPVFVP